MLPPNNPDRIPIVFDDHRLVANAGLLLPVTLALHLSLSQLVQKHLDPGDAPGQANTGDKVMTLVASALAGGDCIDDDDDVLRTGGTASAIGCVVKAPSTLGTFLRSFRWGHALQLEADPLQARALRCLGCGRRGSQRVLRLHSEAQRRVLLRRTNPGDQRAPDGASRRHDEVHCGARPSACVVRDGADARAGCGLRGPDQTRLRPESTGDTPLGPEIPGPRGGVELRLILVSEHACGDSDALLGGSA